MNKDLLKKQFYASQKIRDLSLTQKKFPKKTQILQNLGKSVIKNVRHVSSGGQLKLNEEEKNKRFDICKNCNWFDPKTEKCFQCGCYLKIKTYLKAESCPIGKW
jgi:hypothetical protein